MPGCLLCAPGSLPRKQVSKGPPSRVNRAVSCKRNEMETWLQECLPPEGWGMGPTGVPFGQTDTNGVNVLATLPKGSHCLKAEPPLCEISQLGSMFPAFCQEVMTFCDFQGQVFPAPAVLITSREVLKETSPRSCCQDLQ